MINSITRVFSFFQLMIPIENASQSFIIYNFTFRIVFQFNQICGFCFQAFVILSSKTLKNLNSLLFKEKVPGFISTCLLLSGIPTWNLSKLGTKIFGLSHNDVLFFCSHILIMIKFSLLKLRLIFHCFILKSICLRHTYCLHTYQTKSGKKIGSIQESIQST